MKENRKVSPPIDWRAIFEKRPDLNPPGYDQVFQLIKHEKESTNEAT